ncbi:MAG: 4-hydroxy-tetrahydrodipicolinate reductase [Clostridiales bacterium]|nr:4-hydroxy-tetrahydrodipicolinate reductase [Clostridiales bacterium]
MTKIIIHGANGKMGHVVEEIVSGLSDCQIVAGIDPRCKEEKFPVFASPADCDIKADVIIDFSTSTAVPALLDFAREKKIPAVICTTGLNDTEKAYLEKTAKQVAILRSANMSVGVNLLLNLVQQVAAKLADSGFDIEIIEKHHNQKIDAPSGTALAIAEAINETAGNEYEYVYDRSNRRCKRPKQEIGISAIRGGSIVGEHEILFCGKDEIIELNHRAMSKEIFAVGAVKAARFLAGKPAGLYSMKDVMAD